MKSPMRIRTVLLAAAFLAVAAPVRSAYVTPPNKVVIDFQPSFYEFNDSYRKARTVTFGLGYAYAIQKYQYSSSLAPIVGLPQFKQVVESDYGIFLHACHGISDVFDGDFLGVESFPETDAGRTAAIARTTAYQSTYGISFDDIKAIHRVGWAWYIGLSANGIAQLRNVASSSEALVYSSACFSAATASGWGARTFLGYSDLVENSIAIAQADTFFHALGGGNGAGYRSTSGADFITNSSFAFLGHPQLELQGSFDMVLAPALAGYTYADNFTEGTFDFDTEMYTGGFGNPLSISGAVGSTAWWWAGSTTLVYSLQCNYDGVGNVDLITAGLTAPNGIKLNVDGVGGNTEGFRVSYNCDGGINPAAALDNFVVTSEGSGNWVRWTTDWESNTNSFTVLRKTSGGPTDSLATVPAHGAGAYGTLDPLGSFLDTYLLVEHQSGGARDLTYGPQPVRPPITPVTAEPITYDPAGVQAILESIPDPPAQGPESIGMYYLAIVCPDSFATTAELHRNLWISKGVSAAAVPLSDALARGGIKTTLTTMYGVATRAAILVGDASDAQKFGVAWPPGWPKPSPAWPLQPGKNLLPMFYTDEPADSPSVSMSYFTPYFASDLPYADIDDDGLPDLILGRIPAGTNAQYQAYVAKLTTYLNTSPAAPWANKASQLVYAVDFGTVPGNPLAVQAESLAAHYPPTVQLSKMIDRNGPPTTWTTLQLDSIFKSHWNAGRSFIHIGSTNTNRSNYAFAALQWGFSMSQLAANNKFPVVLATSCDMADFDRTESPDQGTPMCERLLFEPNKGALAIIGPTRGTYQLGNVTLAQIFLDAMFKSRGKNIGTAFLEAQRALLVLYPQFANLARSYILLGDPLVAPLGAVAITAVGDSRATPRTGLAPPSPNPFNPSTVLTVHLAHRAHARLAVYDVAGRLVRTLVDRVLPAGTTRLTWNAVDNANRPVASGVYFTRLSTPDTDSVEKLVYLK